VFATRGTSLRFAMLLALIISCSSIRMIPYVFLYQTVHFIHFR
jgi:hypothetical protein